MHVKLSLICQHMESKFSVLGVLPLARHNDYTIALLSWCCPAIRPPYRISAAERTDNMSPIIELSEKR